MDSEEIKETSSSTIHLLSAEQTDPGPGIYAVPVLPFSGTMPGFPAGNLIPLTYKIPTRPNPAGAVSEGTSQEAQQQHGQHRRQVVERRFQFAIQIDITLILKLAAVVFLFNQEGSRQRLILLILFASLIYLYQTGAFTPILRWLQRAAAPPQPQAAVRPENAPPVVQDHVNDHLPEGNPGAENQNQATENGPADNENQAEVGRANGVDWWGIAKEIKMIVVGFITSLFPGFHHHND